MYRLIRLVILISLLMISVNSWAAGDLERDMQNILKLKISPEEIIDSIGTFTLLPENNIRDSVQAAKAEKFYRNQLMNFAIKKKCSDKYIARIYDTIGLMCLHQGSTMMAQAQEAFEKALEFSKNVEDPYLQGVIFEHMSQAASKYGNLSDSFRFSQDAINCFKKAGVAAEQRTVRCYYAQAIAYLRSADLSGLRMVIDSIAAFSKKVSPDNLPHALYNLYSIQEVYYGNKIQDASPAEKKVFLDSLNQVSLASVLLIDAYFDEWKNSSIDPTWNYYNRAVLILESSDHPNIDSIQYYLNKAKTVDVGGKTHMIEIEISSASVLAETWMKYGEYAKAKDILLSTIKLLDNTEGINNVLYDKIEIYKNLVEISRQSGHYKEALEYADILSAAEKERFSQEKAKDIKELEIKYKTQETELALSQSKAKSAKTLMWFFAAVGMLLICIIGFVIFANRQKRKNMQKEMEFAALKEDIGHQLTLQYIEGLENERQRMSRELHDGVCNDLLAIQMNISGGKSIESTAKLIDSCRESVRRISHELMPPEFAYASIEEVVRYFIAKQSAANEGKIEFSFSSSIEEGYSWQDVPDAVSLEIYRIIQEAVGNAVKHSGASNINVLLSLNDKTLLAEVEDNGSFKTGGKKGIGLDSIQRRAKSVNGTVEISSDENSFTTVLIKIKV